MCLNDLSGTGDAVHSDHGNTVDIAVIGAGAAGLATAIFAARQAPNLRIHCLDGARHVGAKILVSGGSRCNVTNRVVNDSDFWGGSSRIVRSILRAFPAEHAAAFFEELGVRLHEEDDGKLFPDSNRSRSVLDALLLELERVGVRLDVPQRVCDVRVEDGVFHVATARGRACSARALVLATGGRSLPKTGSDGYGYELARQLGHGQVDTTPGLAPLLLGGDRHKAITGVSHPAVLTLRVNNETRIRLEGPLLWTHFGMSGPVALNMSRHWHRAQLRGDRAEVVMNICPGETFESLEASLLDAERSHPRARVATMIGRYVPAAIADAWIAGAMVNPDTTMAHLGREDRRRLIHALIGTPLDVRDSRGYGFAEVTAGGVPLDEVDPRTLESRRCPGLYFAGEILDVDGRLGGFNFQWAWSSGWVAGRAIARALRAGPTKKVGSTG